MRRAIWLGALRSSSLPPPPLATTSITTATALVPTSSSLLALGAARASASSPMTAGASPRAPATRVEPAISSALRTSVVSGGGVGVASLSSSAMAAAVKAPVRISVTLPRALSPHTSASRTRAVPDLFPATAPAAARVESPEDGMVSMRDREAFLRVMAAYETASHALEPSDEQRKTITRTVTDRATKYLGDVIRGTVPSHSAVTREPHVLPLTMPLPTSPMPLDQVLNLFDQHVVRPGTTTCSGADVAHVPGGGIYHAALSDYYAAVTNKYSADAGVGPGAVRLESIVIRWVAQILGFDPERSAGVHLSGASVATLTAVATARDCPEHAAHTETPRSCVVYMTSNTHHCMTKALHIAGMGRAQLRIVGEDAQHRMSSDALERAIAADVAAGLHPWLICATAGTTNTGSVDPLDAIADVASRHGVWMHTDAAYGGFFMLVDYGRRLMKGIERSDSVVLDPHKGLFLPFGSGIVLVRNGRLLRNAHAKDRGHYLQEASKRAGAVLNDTNVENVMAYSPPTLDEAALERVNQAIADHVLSQQVVFMSSTRVDGRFTLRFIALASRTHRTHADLAIAALERAKLAIQAQLHTFL